MFVVSVKTNKKQLISLLICLAVLITVVLVSILRPMGDTTTSVTLADDAARVSYLRQLGYEVDASAQIEEVLLPDQWDDPLVNYNNLQRSAGFDLAPYLGKRVKCWTYTVTNLPDKQAVAHLYTFRDHLIAGDITTRDGTQMTALVSVGVSR